MGCLTVCRWCCCCFLATVNALTTICGILYFVLGCTVLWGYWVLRQHADKYIKDVATQMQESNAEAKIDPEVIHKALESLLGSVAIALLVLGALLIIIGCLGCCGACFGVPACLIIYAVIVGLLIIAQATVVIIWFADSNTFKGCIRRTLESKVASYRGIQNMDVNTIQIDLLQIGMGCCGAFGGDDFLQPGAQWNRTTKIQDKNGNPRYINMSHPYSCCKYIGQKPSDPNCVIYGNATRPNTNYQTGCYPMLMDFMENKLMLNNFASSLAGSLVMDLLLIAGALVIFFHKRQEQADIPHSGVQYKMQPQMA